MISYPTRHINQLLTERDKMNQAFIPNNVKNVVFDLGGTLSICDQRTHHVSGEVKDWTAFVNACDKDTVNEPIATLFRFYRESPLHRVWVLTGRAGNAGVSDDTDVHFMIMTWLHDNDLQLASHNRTSNGMMMMREKGDERHDVEVKKEFLAKSDITPENTEIVFEDRTCMVEAYRFWGFTCAQVAGGDF